MGRPKGAYNPRFEEILNDLMRKHDPPLSQAKVAKMIGKDPTNFNKIVKKCSITDEVAIDLAEIFGVSPIYLQGYTDDPNYFPKTMSYSNHDSTSFAKLKVFHDQRDVFREYCESIGIEFCYNKDAFSDPESVLIKIDEKEKGIVDSMFYKHFQNAVQNAALNILETMINTVNTQQMYWRELLDTGSISDMPEKDYSKPLD